MQEFNRYQRSRNLRPSTIEHRHRVINAFAATLRERADLLVATEADVLAWLDACAISARTRNTYLSVLDAFYTWAVARGYAEINPTVGIERPRLPRLLPRPALDDDFSAALEAADPRMRAWLCLAGYQGLRCFEIAGLDREDVLDGLPTPLLLVRDGKGGHQRMLPLHPETARVLHALPMPSTGTIFTMVEGGPYRASTISAYICRFLHSLGLSVTPHNLRHWFGSTVYQQSRDLRLTQELLGHASPVTTAGYAAFSPRAAAEIVRGLSAGS